MLASLKNLWTQAPLPQRAALIAVLVLVFGGILFTASTAGKPPYGVLFAGLEPDDAGAVTGKLRELKVEYRLTQSGRAIEVPQDRVDDLRLMLATEGLPRGGSVGFELFDRTSFGVTDFTQHVNYQRAIQGELTRTISRLDGVGDCRVHVVIPERRLFTDRQEPTTASVLLRVRPGHQLSESQVGGIVHLVSRSVAGLTAENVTVHDERGNLLSSAASRPQSDLQLRQQEEYERRLERDLLRLADRALGPGKAAIRVSAELTTEQTETTSETFQPSGPNGANLPVQEDSTSESYERNQGGAGGVVGEPRVASPELAGGGSAAGATVSIRPGQYVNTRRNTQFVVNKVVEKRTTPAGKIRRLSVAVLLDQTVTLAQRAPLRDVFAAAAGLDTRPATAGGRGDRIELLPMTFDRSAETASASAEREAAGQSFRLALIRNGAAVAVVLILLIGTALVLRRARGSRPSALDVVIRDPVPLPAEAALVPSQTGRMLADDPDTGPDTTPAGRLRKLAVERPDEVARHLQAWISE